MFSSKKSLSIVGFALLLCVMGVSTATAQFTQNFDVVPAPGWTTQNNSVPVGSTGWFQGNSTVFPSQGGAATSYIGANFNNTTGTNTISNWLISPQTNLNGGVLTFYTRTTTANPFPDRLQVRLSTAGASTNVGTGPAGLGDFTTLLLDINPTYQTGGVYPETWTQFTVNMPSLPAGSSGRIAFRYFVEFGGPTGDNSNYIGIDTVSFGAGVTPAADQVLDVNDDGKTDFVTVRNTGGGAGGQVTWTTLVNGGGVQAAQWGISTDFFVMGDYDGDGKDDVTVWRPGAAGTAAYYVLRSSNMTALIEPFGQTGDDPTVVGDYNGDGTDDFAVYRGGASAGQPSTWFYRTAPGGAVTFAQWGQNGDFPAPGDYDGNGTNDLSIQRNGGGGQANFWTRLSTGAVTVTTWGTPTDVIVPGDYDGDGKTDIATIRGISGVINWFIKGSAGTDQLYVPFGASATDFPTQGDYDGDGKTDMAIWRPSATAGASAFWYRGSTGATVGIPFGQNGDYPVANFNSH
jgi:hypothetical protein